MTKNSITGKNTRKIIREEVTMRNIKNGPSEDKRIKVLRIIARLNIGGPAIHVHLLTEGVDKRRFQSKLITGSISPQEGDMGYLFQSSNGKPIIIPELQREISLKSDFKVLLKVLRILGRERPEIVHTHTAKAGTVGRTAVILYNLMHLKRIRLVHTFHGHVFDGYFGKLKSSVFVWIERFLAKRTDRIIAISETQRRDLAGKYRIAPASKIRTIGLGFDLSPFLSSASRKGHFRRSIGVDNKTLLIGIVGRLVPIKNHRMFLDGAKEFLEKNPEINAKFIIIGDGELREELEEYCRANSLADHVLFCGWIKDVASVYADLDILALTSNNEGTPVSIIEAMASSVPVAATDVGGVSDLMGEPEVLLPSGGLTVCRRGILCEKGRALKFAEGLQYMFHMNSAEKQRRIERARFFVESTYSKDRLIREIENVYSELLLV